MSTKYLLALAAIAAAVTQAQADTSSELELTPAEIAALVKMCFTYDSEENCVAFKGVCRWVANKFHHGKCIAHFKSSVAGSASAVESQSTILDLDNDQIDALAAYELSQFETFEQAQEVSSVIAEQYAKGSITKQSSMPGFGRRGTRKTKEATILSAEAEAEEASEVSKNVTPLPPGWHRRGTRKLAATKQSSMPGFGRRGTRQTKETILSAEAATEEAASEEASEVSKNVTPLPPGWNRRGTRKLAATKQSSMPGFGRRGTRQSTILSAEAEVEEESEVSKNVTPLPPGWNRRGTRKLTANATKQSSMPGFGRRGTRQTKETILSAEAEVEEASEVSKNVTPLPPGWNRRGTRKLTANATKQSSMPGFGRRGTRQTKEAILSAEAEEETELSKNIWRPHNVRPRV